jgi:hypothetical protein
MLVEESKNHHTGKILTVASVQSRDIKRAPSHEIRHFCDSNGKNQQGMQTPTPRRSFTFICRLLSLIMVLAIGPTLALAQEGGHVGSVATLESNAWMR